ncbi:MAG: DUF4982 domain-containing protein [Tidjanibacter sp.]|nr:DUF4982 domain-containing protein [Tidjanibacter sp.]
MKNYTKLALMTLVATLALAHSASAARVVRTIDSGWKFALTTDNAAAIDFCDKEWKQVNLPHSWNADDSFDDVDGYARTIGWYRKTLHLNKEEGKQYTLRIGAANQYAEVYINGTLVGSHIGGYLAFSNDITALLQNGSNTIAIKVDNSHNADIGPLSADFTFYGGIYRSIELIETPKTHISTTYYATKGLLVRTPEVSAEKATVEVEVLLSSVAKERAEVVVDILDTEGNVVATKSRKVKLAEGAENHSERIALTLTQPKLWDVEAPNLYIARASLVVNKEVVDCVNDRFGVRYFTFTPNEGLTLNGRHVKLIGTNRHQDYLGLGNALPDAMHVSDVELLKEMGGNSLRVSHYPQHERVMEACDRLGIVTSVEIPLVNAVTISEGFTASTLQMTEEMLYQNFNSPSVFIWAYMNEIQLRHPSTDKEWLQTQYYPYLVGLAKQVDNTLRTLDPTRYTLLPCHHAPSRYIESGIAAVPQMLGWNIYSGWYSGVFKDFEKILDKLHEQFPNQILTISEYGADADSRLHSSAPERFDYTLDYSELYHEHYLPKILKRDFIASGNVWNLNDFGSESRGDAIPHTNLKGLNTFDRKHKDIYYYYKAALNTTPVVHIGNSAWNKRAGAENGEGVSVQRIKVYTNQPSVELFHNGASLGTKQVENYHAIFEVPFTNGENSLEAVTAEVKDFYTCEFDLVEQHNPEEINVLLGTNRYFEEPRTGVTWIPEQAYTPGSWGYIGGEQARQRSRHGSQPASAAAINNTDCDPMYQTQRSNIEAFRADVAPGNYSVYLHFAELAGKVKASVYNLGNEAISSEGEERVFDVSINGVKVLTDLDIAACVGVYNPLVERFEVDVKAGESLIVEFTPKKGAPVLNAITIRKNF